MLSVLRGMNQSNFSWILNYSRETTKIRIPVRKIRDAASMVMDLDSPGLCLTLEEKVKKRKLTEERDGWVDMTEVFK